MDAQAFWDEREEKIPRKKTALHLTIVNQRILVHVICTKKGRIVVILFLLNSWNSLFKFKRMVLQTVFLKRWNHIKQTLLKNHQYLFRNTLFRREETVVCCYVLMFRTDMVRKNPVLIICCEAKSQMMQRRILYFSNIPLDNIPR